MLKVNTRHKCLTNVIAAATTWTCVLNLPQMLLTAVTDTHVVWYVTLLPLNVEEVLQQDTAS